MEDRGQSAWNTYAAPANVTGIIKDTSGSYASGTVLVKAQDNGSYGNFAVISAMQLTAAPPTKAQGTLITIQ